MNFAFQIITYTVCLSIGATTSVTINSYLPIAMVVIIVAVAVYITSIKVRVDGVIDDKKVQWKKIDELKKGQTSIRLDLASIKAKLNISES